MILSHLGRKTEALRHLETYQIYWGKVSMVCHPCWMHKLLSRDNLYWCLSTEGATLNRKAKMEMKSRRCNYFFTVIIHKIGLNKCLFIRYLRQVASSLINCTDQIPKHLSTSHSASIFTRYLQLRTHCRNSIHSCMFSQITKNCLVYMSWKINQPHCFKWVCKPQLGWYVSTWTLPKNW